MSTLYLAKVVNGYIITYKKPAIAEDDIYVFIEYDIFGKLIIIDNDGKAYRTNDITDIEIKDVFLKDSTNIKKIYNPNEIHYNNRLNSSTLKQKIKYNRNLPVDIIEELWQKCILYKIDEQYYLFSNNDDHYVDLLKYFIHNNLIEKILGYTVDKFKISINNQLASYQMDEEVSSDFRDYCKSRYKLSFHIGKTDYYFCGFIEYLACKQGKKNPFEINKKYIKFNKWHTSYSHKIVNNVEILSPKTNTIINFKKSNIYEEDEKDIKNIENMEKIEKIIDLRDYDIDIIREINF